MTSDQKVVCHVTSVKDKILLRVQLQYPKTKTTHSIRPKDRRDHTSPVWNSNIRNSIRARGRTRNAAFSLNIISSYNIYVSHYGSVTTLEHGIVGSSAHKNQYKYHVFIVFLI
uniref:Uncharacterized protein n=1 Tax=Caenorhabditis japonica TaxID=281687 RepID=A0A8R1DYA4_CAEJA